MSASSVPTGVHLGHLAAVRDGVRYATPRHATPSFSPAQLPSTSEIGRALLVDRRSHDVRAINDRMEFMGMAVSNVVFDPASPTHSG
uniref:Uncharacterized protein n=1 Tax=Oryza punctata TaxID=4537 RepID=A0A0E0M6A8_ORYPU